jgi:hypothetical protein
MVTVYNSLVDARSWSSDIPTSIQTARDYYKHVDPRRFYAMLGPPKLLLSLLTIILFWKVGAAWCLYFADSLALYAAILVLIFAYFVPRDLLPPWMPPRPIVRPGFASDWPSCFPREVMATV